MSGGELTDTATASFGTTTVGTAVSRTFTVTNVGSGTLSLTALSSTTMPAGFSLVSNLTDLSLTAGQSTSFTVRFGATTVGSFAGPITIRSNDSNESLFDLRLSANATTTATPTPSPTSTATTLLKRTLDDGATGFVKSGVWTTITGRGVASDMNQAVRGTGSNNATWSFTSIPNGKYQVYGSWLGASTNATNAPFTLYNGSTPVATVRASQRVNSSGLTADGANWKLLGTVTVTSGRLNVRLNNLADGTVVADAIRIVQTATTSATEPTAADLGLLAWLNERPGLTADSLRQASAEPAADQPSAGRAIAVDHGPTTQAPSWLDTLDDIEVDATNTCDEALEATLDLLGTLQA
jgi:hypothetical protein